MIAPELSRQLPSDEPRNWKLSWQPARPAVCEGSTYARTRQGLRRRFMTELGSLEGIRPAIAKSNNEVQTNELRSGGIYLDAAGPALDHPAQINQQLSSEGAALAPLHVHACRDSTRSITLKRLHGRRVRPGKLPPSTCAWLTRPSVRPRVEADSELERGEGWAWILCSTPVTATHFHAEMCKLTEPQRGCALSFFSTAVEMFATS